MTENQSTHIRSPHALYRFYDAAGALLYVGITLNPAARWKQHSKDKPWWGDVADIKLEHHPDRASVLNAERTAIITERPRHNVVHNRGRSTAPAAPVESAPTENIWTFTSRGGYERTTDLHLYWEVNGTAMSDNWLPDEIDAQDLLRMWVDQYGQERYVSIYWSVWPVHETAPFQATKWWNDGRNFLTYHTWPRHAHTDEPLNWNTLPVLDGTWTLDDHSKGGFFQEATGWKPAPLQPIVDLHQVLGAAGMPYLVPRKATA